MLLRQRLLPGERRVVAEFIEGWRPLVLPPDLFKFAARVAREVGNKVRSPEFVANVVSQLMSRRLVDVISTVTKTIWGEERWSSAAK